MFLLFLLGLFLVSLFTFLLLLFDDRGRIGQESGHGPGGDLGSVDDSDASASQGLDGSCWHPSCQGDVQCLQILGIEKEVFEILQIDELATADGKLLK